ncbi:MAG: hypothetical protein KY468_07915 [Armatimonadetes bacterium]|nr:hypothetical protein [Armatimonadota bacterium]
MAEVDIQKQPGGHPAHPSHAGHHEHHDPEIEIETHPWMFAILLTAFAGLLAYVMYSYTQMSVYPSISFR